VQRLLILLLSFAVTSAASFAADHSDNGVNNVIQQFQQALERHDVAAIGALVSPDVVVLENGHRNQGWADFRDNHVIPEFKEPAAPSKWEFVKVVTSPGMAWGYTKEKIDVTGKDARSKRAVHRGGAGWRGPGTCWTATAVDRPLQWQQKRQASSGLLRYTRSHAISGVSNNGYGSPAYLPYLSAH
jgi:ketosteroid isomerase-like protein